MANVTAKTSSNIFYKARCEAATHNEQLSSREGAADYMSIYRGRLYRIESVLTVSLSRFASSTLGISHPNGHIVLQK